MSADLFVASAQATAPILVQSELSLGQAIRECAQATFDVAACNTNLGIILLCVPLAHAAMACETSLQLPETIKQLLDSADIEDTQGVFDAIALLSPAGLGESRQHDARQPAVANLYTVMQQAASRDRIALQYTTGFTDVLAVGSQFYRRAIGEAPRRCRNSLEAATLAVYFDFLSTYSDSHIARKYGAYMAEVVRDEALDKRELYNSLVGQMAQLQFLRQYDDELKYRGINPGTSADLTVATLFLSLMSERF